MGKEGGREGAAQFPNVDLQGSHGRKPTESQEGAAGSREARGMCAPRLSSRAPGF